MLHHALEDLDQSLLETEDSKAHKAKIMCKDIYENTYGLPLPESSKEMLRNIVLSLTTCEAEPSTSQRSVFTVWRAIYERPLLTLGGMDI